MRQVLHASARAAALEHVCVTQQLTRDPRHCVLSSACLTLRTCSLQRAVAQVQAGAGLSVLLPGQRELRAPGVGRGGHAGR